MTNKAHILSTALLGEPLINKANEEGIDLDIMPFIEINPVTGKGIKDKVIELCNLPITVVFTSVSAVKAVADIALTADPMWDIYCIGNATMDAVNAKFNAGVVKGVANDAAGLAAIIIANAEDEVIFFCGDQRMDTLPDALRENDITVYEVIVYRTKETPQAVTKEYDGILFFSPSAVNSFFSVNKIGSDTILFAIGNTTANAIKKHTSNKVVFSETATKESVLAYAIQYFKKQS